MLIEHVLISLSSSEWFIDTFMIREDELDDVGLVRKAVIITCKEFHLNFVERDFVGYYSIDTNTLTISGLHPLTLKEFFIWALYASRLVFYKPNDNISVEFVYTLGQFLGFDLSRWLCIKEDFDNVCKEGGLIEENH